MTTALDIQIREAKRAVDAATREFRKLLLIAVSRRDGTFCKECGVPTIMTLEGHPRRRTLDHIIPQALGGKDTMNNLQLLCQTCNSSKGKQVDRALLCPSCTRTGHAREAHQ